MESYLSIYLANLANQTIFNSMEILLDHNSPTIEEIKLVKKFQKKYPGKLRHFINKKVLPYSVSINKCIKRAKGKYLAIWNIDDLRVDDSIEIQYKTICNSNYQFCYGNYFIVDQFGKKTGKFVDLKNIDENKELLQSMILGPFFMFKKSVCDKIGYYDEQLISGGDFDFAIKLAREVRGKKILKNLGFYLNDQKGLSTKKNSTQVIEKDLICLRYGIFHKVNLSSIFKIMNYDIKNTKYNNKYYPINKFFKFYDEYIIEKVKKYKKFKLINFLLNNR